MKIINLSLLIFGELFSIALLIEDIFFTNNLVLENSKSIPSWIKITILSVISFLLLIKIIHEFENIKFLRKDVVIDKFRKHEVYLSLLILITISFAFLWKFKLLDLTSAINNAILLFTAIAVYDYAIQTKELNYLTRKQMELGILPKIILLPLKYELVLHDDKYYEWFFDEKKIAGIKMVNCGNGPAKNVIVEWVNIMQKLNPIFESINSSKSCQIDINSNVLKIKDGNSESYHIIHNQEKFKYDLISTKEDNYTATVPYFICKIFEIYLNSHSSNENTFNHLMDFPILDLNIKYEDIDDQTHENNYSIKFSIEIIESDSKNKIKRVAGIIETNNT